MSQLVDEKFVVKYVESGKSIHQEVYWCVMEYLSGESMDCILDTCGPVSELNAVKVRK